MTIVAIVPGPTDLPAQIEGGHHITLAYFGDTDLDPKLTEDLSNIVFELSQSTKGLRSTVAVTGEAYLGEDGEAHVITLDDSPGSPVVLLRKMLINMLTPELEAAFRAAETYPVFKPHMTLGYLNEGYRPEPIDIPETLLLTDIGVWSDFIKEGYPLVLDENVEYLNHVGVARKSGRYPWGSGENPHQRNKSFTDYVDDLHKKGLSEVEIAKGMDITTAQLRARKTIAKNQLRQDDIDTAMKLKAKDWSNVAIGAHIGRNESYVRGLLDPATQAKNDILVTTAKQLKDEVAAKGLLDIGLGTEQYLGVSGTKMNTAVAMLKEDGYRVDTIKVETTPGKFTEVKVLSPPGTTYGDIINNSDKIGTVSSFSEDGGRTYLSMQPPLKVGLDRINVRYADEGGSDMDGVIQIRRGVDDISLGSKKYAQVRIAVEGDRYLKGMAMYTDDLPDGVDMVFNTNKKNTGNKLDAMKKMNQDEENPFGAIVRQRIELDADGKPKVTSAMNIVNEEGDWDKWSKNLSSQMLSKQTTALAKQQLNLTLATKQDQYDEIMALTNPAVRKKLLETYADSAESSSVRLKAAALPRQRTHVILPINALKDNEIYAPFYNNGETVALVRYPHGGIFEIPELVVNNRNRAAKSVMNQAIDAVGINSKVAARLSGADFDGDTVLVIPNNRKSVKSSSPLDGLKDFDPQARYPGYEGMKVMKDKQKSMGDISNLITDMTIKGANNSEIARAVRHSMVVIDAEKHSLNYKQSAEDNRIKELKTKYQGKSNAGASTLISLSRSQAQVPSRKLRSAKDGGPIDKATGKKVYVEVDNSYVDKKGRTVVRKMKSTKMQETDDARALSSGTPMEEIYASHANQLKALSNEARRVAVNTKSTPYNPSAKIAYANEVASLKASLNLAYRNKPLERQAQLLASAQVAAKRKASPSLDSADLKKIKKQALDDARARTGARKTDVKISQSEWDAIQAGAISNNMLNNILNNTDLDRVKQLANPRDKPVMSDAKAARAKAMFTSGYTQSEIAQALGIPTSTLSDSLNG